MREQVHEFSRSWANTLAAAVLVRPIRPDDQPELRGWFATVSPESRYARFLGFVTELSPKQWSYLTDVDGHDHVAFVACLDGRIVGVGRWIRDDQDPAQAEIAFLIGDAVQRCGVGRLLCARLIEAARVHGVRRFRAHVLPHNQGIRRLLRGRGLEPLLDSGRILEVAIRDADQRAEGWRAPGRDAA